MAVACNRRRQLQAPAWRPGPGKQCLGVADNLSGGSSSLYYLPRKIPSEGASENMTAAVLPERGISLSGKGVEAGVARRAYLWC